MAKAKVKSAPPSWWAERSKILAGLKAKPAKKKAKTKKIKVKSKRPIKTKKAAKKAR